MQTFTRGNLTFDVVDAGPAEGAVGEEVGGESPDPVVLLHGFPQTSLAWSAVMDRLVAEGRRCLAPDLRGYSPGARPRGAAAYRLDAMAGDVLALLDAAGADRGHIVGHDWGGGLAWEVAMRHPERVSRLTVLSTPHPAAMGWAMHHSNQRLRSWYMMAFQVPLVPEALLKPVLKRLGMRGLGLSPQHEQAYVARLSEPGALTGAINWYRALATKAPAGRTAESAPDGVSGRDGERRPVTCPTTYVWGRRDAYLGRAAAERTEVYVDGPYRFIELDADHWLPEKHPAEVAEAILEPLGDAP